MENEGERKLGGASGIMVDENCGRKESCQGDNSRGASRDTVASLAKRMVGIETSISELKEQVEESHQHLEDLGSNFAELREDFKSALNVLGGNLGREIHDLRNILMGKITWMRGEVEEELGSLRRELEDLQADLSLCKRFIASGEGNTGNIALKMEQYTKGVNIVDDAPKIKMATCYLKDTSSLWWRRQYGDIER
ncbi:hypothetical protein Tco_1423706, partial [Tanacetum coccineum]